MWKKILDQLEFPESFVSLTLGFLVIIVGGLLIYNYFIKSKNIPGSTQEEKVEQKLEEKAATFPMSHTVSENENLWTIAEKYYGSGYNWVTLALENKLPNPNFITIGQILAIPKAEAIRPISEKVSAASIEPEKTYIVVRDDNLWNIAVREYQDGYSWVKIARANNLANPDLIHPGNILRLPQ
jgi:nucleoid-associated protein YgaU